MDPYLGEWLNLGLRWTHVITGIAWIGSSFFFMWLDSHLTAPEPPAKDVEGELWMVHSGGFYRVHKIMVAPDPMPKVLHWFVWEATFTWVSGFLLLVLVYYLGAAVYLVDPAVSGISPGEAVALGLGTLVVGWAVYDLLWRSPLGRNHGALAAAVSFLLLAGVAYGLSRVMSGRGAFIHVGAMLGTLMAANVWMRIIPAQRQLVAARKEGRAPDPALGAAAKQRSVHNNYMTLPVVFVMLSSHYPVTYGHPWNWAILLALFVAGAAVRHCFNLRNRGRGRAGLWYAAAGVAVAVAVMIAIAPRRGEVAAGPPVAFADVRGIVARRCLPCHSQSPTSESFDTPPRGVVFDTADDIRLYAARIRATAVDARLMPLGNVTEMTEEERALLGRWIDQGAEVD